MAAPELRVNEKFAERYRRYRRREELQRLYSEFGDLEVNLGGPPGSPISPPSQALDPRQEREFYRTLALLKTRDPRIYQKDTTFYTQPESSGSDEEEESEEEGEARPAKPMYLKDYERKVVLEKEG
ncbi:KRI1 protein, partial [Sclerurus mexicanus]|nr:KRI1 protein [Sclerurus mexicanus]